MVFEWEAVLVGVGDVGAAGIVRTSYLLAVQQRPSLLKHDLTSYLEGG